MDDNSTYRVVEQVWLGVVCKVGIAEPGEGAVYWFPERLTNDPLWQKLLQGLAEVVPQPLLSAVYTEWFFAMEESQGHLDAQLQEWPPGKPAYKPEE